MSLVCETCKLSFKNAGGLAKHKKKHKKPVKSGSLLQFFQKHSSKSGRKAPIELKPMKSKKSSRKSASSPVRSIPSIRPAPAPPQKAMGFNYSTRYARFSSQGPCRDFVEIRLRRKAMSSWFLEGLCKLQNLQNREFRKRKSWFQRRTQQGQCLLWRGKLKNLCQGLLLVRLQSACDQARLLFLPESDTTYRLWASQQFTVSYVHAVAKCDLYK